MAMAMAMATAMAVAVALATAMAMAMMATAMALAMISVSARNPFLPRRDRTTFHDKFVIVIQFAPKASQGLFSGRPRAAIRPAKGHPWARSACVASRISPARCRQKEAFPVWSVVGGQ